MFVSRLLRVLSLPRSLVLNIKIFGWGGVRLPVLFSNSVHVKGISRGCIQVANPTPFCVKIGFGGSPEISRTRTSLIFSEGGTVNFRGPAVLSEGTVLSVEGGHLAFGSNFSSNKNCIYQCTKEITLGDDCLLGWNISIRDTDGHSISGPTGELSNTSESICVGNHVWIAANVDVLKGSMVADGSVVATRALVTKQFDDPNSLIGGIPAKLIRRGVAWEF